MLEGFRPKKALKTVGTKGSYEALLRLDYHYFEWDSVEITSVPTEGVVAGHT